jgi:hypothetical protein
MQKHQHGVKSKTLVDGCCVKAAHIQRDANSIGALCVLCVAAPTSAT